MDKLSLCEARPAGSAAAPSSLPAMAAQLIDGKAIAQHVRAEVARRRRRLDRARATWRPGWRPCWSATIPARRSTSATSRRRRAEVGIAGFDHRLPQDASHEEVEALLRELDADPRVSGILLQLPTPPQVDGPALTELIPPGKDVDGLTPVSAGLLAQGAPGLRPCTPPGVMELLRRHEVALRGRRGGRGRALGPRRPAARGAAAGAPTPP